MKTIFKSLLLIVIIATLSVGSDAQTKDEEISLPEVKTLQVKTITHYTCIAGGKIISDGGSTIVKSGICWSKSNPLPDFSGDYVVSKGNAFNEYLKCLDPNSKYYVRAFATNSKGTAFGDVVVFNTLSDQNNTASDIEGNIYKIVKIGDQIWFRENLRTTRYNNGASIPTTTEEIYEAKEPKYQWVAGNNPKNNANYGRLYTWHVVNDKRNLCPCGWHVPSKEEWTQLIEFLGGPEVAGGKMKEAGTGKWLDPNEGANNSSGFSAIPAGIRDYTTAFSWFGQSATFWSNTENDVDDAFYYTLDHTNAEIGEDVYSKNAAYSVRCIKD